MKFRNRHYHPYQNQNNIGNQITHQPSKYTDSASQPKKMESKSSISHSKYEINPLLLPRKVIQLLNPIQEYYNNPIDEKNQLRSQNQSLDFDQTQIKNRSPYKQIQQTKNDIVIVKQVYFVTHLDYCDYIQLQTSDNYFVLSKFSIYCGQFNTNKSQKEGNGWILQRYFDRDFNSSYFHYQGQFENDQIVGSGKLFINKSKIICQEGQWLSIQQSLGKKPEIAVKSPQKKINILDTRDLKTGTKILDKRIFISDYSNGFHDQLLNQRDLTILEQKSWLNSSIIDAYIEHLNYEDETHYWTLSKEDRKQYKRLQIVPSWLFTGFHIGKDDQNFKQFKEVFSQFEPINFRIWEIYKKIGFVINSSNVHWYFVQLDFIEMEVLIKDSLKGQLNYYQNLVKILQNLFKKIDKNIDFTSRVCQECTQQRNGYDCGAYTCIKAKILAESFRNDKKLAQDSSANIMNGTDMRLFLLKFIQLKY